MKTKLEKIKETIGPVPRSQVALSFGIALLLAFVALSTDLYRVEAFFFDLRMRLKGDEAISPQVLLIPLGDKALPAGASIDSIATHRTALANLIAQKPRAIVYLNRFDPAEVEARPAEAEAFVALAQTAEKEGVKVFLGSDVDLSGEVLPPYPLSLLPHYPAILHKDGTLFAEDKVMRRMLLTAFGRPAIHLRAAYPDLTDDELLALVPKIRGAYYYKPAEAWHVLIRYPRNTAATLNGFPRLSFSDIVEGKNLGAATGKILLVETMRKEPMNDYGYTPYSRDTYTNPRLVVHGASLDTLLKNNGIILLSRYFDAALTFLFALTLAVVGITMRPSRGVIALLFLSVSLFFASVLAFQFGYALRLVHPLLAMFFTYYLIVPYRAIFEYKKRWEVQEKHDILVQVEEMKGNFMSLMSHDLKTPVARIQGLAEMVLRQGNLSENQRDELAQILESTESLDKFISKILNLTKVESNEIKLNKRSKDLNKILEQCVTKLAFQAKAKNIQVELGLEPLFPIPLDPALLNQVFTNIIDNAIKYSPPQSRVRVLSREVGDQVEVTIEDSGEGLDAKEMEQLFTKFFRGKSHPGDPTKGSGLGLYLSRYFIELHDGSIEAESRRGEGMKFVVKLPLESTQ